MRKTSKNGSRIPPFSLAQHCKEGFAFLRCYRPKTGLRIRQEEVTERFNVEDEAWWESLRWRGKGLALQGCFPLLSGARGGCDLCFK